MNIEEMKQEINNINAALWRSRTEAIRTSASHTQIGHAIDALGRLKAMVEKAEKIENPSKWTGYWKALLVENEALREHNANIEEDYSYKVDYWKRMHNEVQVELIKVLNEKPELIEKPELMIDKKIGDEIPKDPDQLVSWRKFNEWMVRNLPVGTIIGDPSWWAHHIYTRFIRDIAKPDYEKAYLVWQDKTEWVQETVKPHELGMHRADVLKQRIEELAQAKEPDHEPVAKAMTAHRAAYFMERFKHEEKMLGPNEQAALDFVISMLEAQPEQQPVAWTVQRCYDDGTPHPCRSLEWAGRNAEDDFPIGTKFYTAPPQCKPLTDEMLRLLKEARTNFEMWKDVAPAVSLCADIDSVIAKASGGAA